MGLRRDELAAVGGPWLTDAKIPVEEPAGLG